jgi:hypothetical protein
MIVFMKRAINGLAIVFVLMCALLIPVHPAIATEPTGDDGGDLTADGITTCAGDAKAITNFLSFPVWYRGLPCDDDGNISIQGGSPAQIVFTIALNVIDIALRLVGILAVGFVLWGGFRYVMARGEPEKAKNALDTILKAVIGLVIARQHRGTVLLCS